MTVHDVLHERHGEEWSLQVGSYPKLRLDPAWVAALLRDHGLSAETDTGAEGLIQINRQTTLTVTRHALQWAWPTDR